MSFPTPLIAYTCFYDGTQDQTTFTSLTQNLAMPPGYERAYVSNLAMEMVLLGFETTLDQKQLAMLAKVASDSLASIKSNNITEQIVDYDAALVSRASSTYNIFRDGGGMLPKPDDTQFLCQNPFELLAMLAFVKGAKSILEIGSRYGQTLLHLSLCSTRRKDRHRRYWRLSRQASRKRESIRICGGMKHVERLRKSRSCTRSTVIPTTRRSVEKIRALGPYDFVMIDGDHSLDGCKADWDNYGWLVGWLPFTTPTLCLTSRWFLMWRGTTSRASNSILQAASALVLSTMARLQLFGTGMKGISPSISAQRRINCYLQEQKDTDRTQISLVGVQVLPRSQAMAPPHREGCGRSILSRLLFYSASIRELCIRSMLLEPLPL
jgi:hypothetical protein